MSFCVRKLSTSLLKNATKQPHSLQNLPKTLKECMDDYFINGTMVKEELDITGWVRSVRDGKDCLFLTIYDGSLSSGKDLQVVIDKSLVSESSNP